MKLSQANSKLRRKGIDCRVWSGESLIQLNYEADPDSYYWIMNGRVCEPSDVSGPYEDVESAYNAIGGYHAKHRMEQYC